MNLIRHMRERDVPMMVRVHLLSFPDFFLTFMGRRFLEILYREILKETGRVCLIAESADREIVGFVVGVPDQVGLFRRMARKRWFVFGLASSTVALRHPGVIPRLLRALRYPAKASKASCPALLMSIAVSPVAAGKGVGQALVHRFLEEMSQQGVDKVCLTTDRENNEATNGFYRKLGFSKVRDFRTPEGRWMNEYVIQTR